MRLFCQLPFEEPDSDQACIQMHNNGNNEDCRVYDEGIADGKGSGGFIIFTKVSFCLHRSFMIKCGY